MSKVYSSTSILNNRTQGMTRSPDRSGVEHDHLPQHAIDY